MRTEGAPACGSAAARSAVAAAQKLGDIHVLIAGTNAAPNAGATMKHAPMRMNGQKISAIHPSSWPLVSVIMVS